MWQYMLAVGFGLTALAEARGQPTGFERQGPSDEGRQDRDRVRPARPATPAELAFQAREAAAVDMVRRAMPLQFFPLYYLDTYPDLKGGFGKDNVAAACKHYHDHGMKEGRRPSPFFDPKYYLDNYPDLKGGFGQDYTKALHHWLGHGFAAEGRRGSSDFDISFYLRSHIDLAGGFGNDAFVTAANHWADRSAIERRKTSPDGSILTTEALRRSDKNIYRVFSHSAFAQSVKVGPDGTVSVNCEPGTCVIRIDRGSTVPAEGGFKVNILSKVFGNGEVQIKTGAETKNLIEVRPLTPSEINLRNESHSLKMPSHGFVGPPLPSNFVPPKR